MAASSSNHSTVDSGLHRNLHLKFVPTNRSFTASLCFIYTFLNFSSIHRFIFLILTPQSSINIRPDEQILHRLSLLHIHFPQFLINPSIHRFIYTFLNFSSIHRFIFLILREKMSLLPSLNSHIFNSNCVFNYDCKPVPALRFLEMATIQIKHRKLYSNHEPITLRATPAISVMLHEFLQFPVGYHERISEIVSLVDPSMRRDLGAFMKWKLHEIATNERGSFEIIFNIDFFTASISMTDGERAVLNRVLIESMEAFQASVRAIPASSSSVEALERMVYETGAFRDVKCVVCQEEFLDGESVTQMPCSHIFHRQCITQWLKQSYYCPICRFEMQTQ